MLFRWWQQYRQRREDEYQKRLQRLVDMHPHDPPFIVAGLLSGIPAVALASAQTLKMAANRRAEEARLRRIVREEIKASGEKHVQENNNQNLGA